MLLRTCQQQGHVPLMPSLAIIAGEPMRPMLCTRARAACHACASDTPTHGSKRVSTASPSGINEIHEVGKVRAKTAPLKLLAARTSAQRPESWRPRRINNPMRHCQRQQPIRLCEDSRPA
eukprot:3450573-Amphidinium_carterae.1